MKNKSKYIHIGIIVIGVIFLSLSAFHSSLWFDESYSVAIAKHNFIDIWKITGADVHPALYYWMLHIVFLIFGNNVMAFRIFSLLATIILTIIGYTHIRKDFGEKCGMTFSFLVCFLPVMTAYSSEVRMYSWSCLFVSLAAIYGYRLYKSAKIKEKKAKIKNLIIFGILSICCLYIHYYALVSTALINLFLLIYFIKNRKDDKEGLIYFLILAGIQILIYIPWLIYLMGQVNHVAGGFWITLDWISTPIESLSFQFRRQLDTDFTLNLSTIVSFVIAILMYIYLGIKTYKLKKNKEDLKPAFLSLGIYFGVVLLMLLVSIPLKQSVLYSRYLFVMTGIYIFYFAYIIGKEENKIIKGIIALGIIILGTISNVQNISINYNKENMELYNYIKEEIREDDIIVYSNIGNGGVACAYFPENTQYFLNLEYWDVEDAYKAYGPGMKTVTNWDFLENYNGRIWIIDSEFPSVYEEQIPRNNIVLLNEPKRIETKYHDYIYNIILVEKVK